MPTSTNGFVQVAPDGAGKRIANVQLLDVVQPDGTVVQVYAQCVVPVDASGNPIEFVDDDYKAAVLDRLDTIAQLLSQIVAR